MPKSLNFSVFGVSTSVGISIAVHAALLAALAMFVLPDRNEEETLILETVFSEERIQEEFSQDLEETMEVATTLNPISGGVVSTSIGSAGAPSAAQVEIETSESLKDPEIEVNVGDIATPGDDVLTKDLGEGKITGETGAVVEGYGAALSRMTAEIVRMMREQRVHVVWLFDESESMVDDQKEIRDKFEKVYEELGLAREQDEKLRRGEEILLTSIWGYGETYHELTKAPTDDVELIRKAISSIPVDESGKENMCQTVREAIRKYRPMSARQKRKLVIIVVSDESGDDGEYVEEAIEEARRTKAPIYVLGREAVFGYPYARQRWYDPKYNLPHWVRINRGPETAYPECLQWDGLRGRWDVYNSGFGPYEMVRMARETNGIFFVLPGEEEDLSGPGANDRRKFEFLAMKEYQPLLLPRKVYADEVTRSPFRKAVSDVILRLNPNDNPLIPGHDPQLNIRTWHYSVTPEEFRAQAGQEVLKAARAMALLNEAIPMLERVRPLRAREESRRWRANYDLAYAQLLSFRVRLFQYMLAMDKHIYDAPQPRNEKNNEWNVHRRREMLEPDDAQFARIAETFKVKMTREEYLQVLKEQEDRSRELYEFVKAEHAGTPWARRAETELNSGFGMTFIDGFRDPNYARVGKEIKIPNF